MPALSEAFPSFYPKRYLKNGHSQTLGAYFLRGKQPDYSAKSHIVELFDNDRLVIHDDKPESWITGDRIVILMHGLCGSHKAPYMVRAADKLNRAGVRTFRVDMRGFGDSTYISRSHLHGGCSQDLLSVIRYVNQLSPLSAISLVGYSIGGNIILRTAGKWRSKIEGIVDSAITICPPVDLVECAGNLRHNGNRLYERYFIKNLGQQLILRRKSVDGLIDSGMAKIPNRLIHFDDQFTAPCWGYSNAIEYYRDASSGPWLDKIEIPTVIVTAKDDPVVPFSMFSRFAMSSEIELVAPAQGGHLGFLARKTRDPDRHWMDWRICQAIENLQTTKENKNLDRNKTTETSKTTEISLPPLQRHARRQSKHAVQR